jgi:hypothetical protein
VSDFPYTWDDVAEAMKRNEPLQTAIGDAAKKMAAREAGAVDEAVMVMLAAGVPVGEIEIAVYPWGTVDDPASRTVVRRRRPVGHFP